MSDNAQRLPPIAITPEHWRIVREILRQHLPNRPVWAYGSRTKGAARPYSDLDLALITDAPLSLDALAALKEAFSESDLPWPVDIVDWSSIGDGFRRIIEREAVVVLDGGAQRTLANVGE